ncbi:hypothetical protein [Nonomuraea roseoviolacea]|uniref:Uncharacterized protein n=1 Tax=Nonomuraea roseoviolacea subsp. carminata TaxID=160689 RepID=A0ABT1K386_9ACTN|nr:hypothetical protein [Nonomuraea roseoviolacea]MCP2348422.1 hypothetical protein [Nonomuraea roseoviolacea subsp. carminata]
MIAPPRPLAETKPESEGDDAVTVDEAEADAAEVAEGENDQ